MKDKNSDAIFDDYVVCYDGGDCWTQVCNSCKEKFNFPENLLDKDIGSGICGVKGCSNEADHYYDFDKDKNIKEDIATLSPDEIMIKAWDKLSENPLDRMYLYRSFLDEHYLPELVDQDRETEASEIEEVLDAMNKGIKRIEQLEEELKEVKKNYKEFAESF